MRHFTCPPSEFDPAAILYLRKNTGQLLPHESLESAPGLKEEPITH